LAQYRAPLPHVDLINRDIPRRMMGGFVTGALLVTVFRRREKPLWQDTHAALFGSADTP
jgi:hypothetical protein